MALRDQVQTQAFTYSGMGVYHPDLFKGYAPDPLPLRPVLEQGIAGGVIFGERFRGSWLDVGTPERLAELEKRFAAAR